MKLPLLALLVVAAAAQHRRTEVSSLEQLQGEESPAQDGETAAGAPGEAGAGAQTLPQEEVEGGSGVEDSLEEEDAGLRGRGGGPSRGHRGPVLDAVSALPPALQSVCQRCYRGSLVSIHSSGFNFQVWCASRGLNAGRVWIGGRRVGWGHCQHFLWTDRSSWNFAYWALGQPFTWDPCGTCVTMCTQGVAQEDVDPADMRLFRLLPPALLLLGAAAAVRLGSRTQGPLLARCPVPSRVALSMVLRVGTPSEAGELLFPEKDVTHLQSPELGQRPDSTSEQEGGLALALEAFPTPGDEACPPQGADACEDTAVEEEAGQSGTAAPDKDSPCPGEEDAIPVRGGPECPTCHYLVVKTPRSFSGAQKVCKRCYGGNLVSIHSWKDNSGILRLASKINQAQVWIGGIRKGWWWWKNFHWTDGSCWNFKYWAPGQPRDGKGCCVALCTKGGHWRRTRCCKRLPFVCSY
ncbi:Proteoglycan 3 [Fukomys damarensis]|uniref:Proteoglycan 3 n=1 Tax=Fukomys damarensis TaxID=885580 RepID=A0A091DG22_FUKDA|nr:Proteoglycan 3 [Fukomys damarensis]